MMISARAGLISRTAFSVDVARFVLRRPFAASASAGDGLHDGMNGVAQETGLCGEVRKEAGIEDARIHDLRHTLASHAVMNGVSVPVLSRLLKHSNVRMTMRYAHLGDRDIEQAAERVGHAIARIMTGKSQR